MTVGRGLAKAMWHMRGLLGIAKWIVLLGAGAVLQPRVAESADLMETYQGSVVVVGPGTLTFAVVGDRTRNESRTITVRILVPETSVRMLLPAWSHIAPQSGSVGDIGVGRGVIVKVANGRAVEVDLLPVADVRGHIVERTAESIMIRVDGGKANEAAATRRFYFAPDRIRVWANRVMLGPIRPASIGELRAGLDVSIVPRGDVAQAVRINPLPTVVGVVTDVGEGGVTVRPTQANPDGAVQHYGLDLSRIGLFHGYFGMPLERAEAADLRSGCLVSVTIEDGNASEIVLVHPAIHGWLTKIEGNLIIVKPAGESAKLYGPEQRLWIDPAETAIYMGRVQSITRREDGKRVVVLHYVLGGTIAELAVGQGVSVTAKGGAVLSMRVNPLLPESRPSHR